MPQISSMQDQLNKKAIPVVFVQKGNSFYLSYATKCAKKFNPESKIIVLTEDTNQKISDCVQYDSKKYSKSREIFNELYVHRSTSMFNVERFCLERWFLLLEFMEKEKVDTVFALDGDVLLFQNITQDFRTWYSEKDFVISQGTCAHVCFVSKKALKEYCKNVMSYYETVHKNPNFGKDDKVTDMFFWAQLAKEKKFSVGDTAELIDYSVYDISIAQPQNGILMKNGLKKIVFQDGLPFGLLEIGAIRLKCLHCQGENKFFMQYFATQAFPLFWKQRVGLMKFFRNNLSSKVSDNVREKIKLWLSKQ